jgi:hypothetical protein
MASSEPLARTPAPRETCLLNTGCFAELCTSALRDREESRTTMPRSGERRMVANALRSQVPRRPSARVPLDTTGPSASNHFVRWRSLPPPAHTIHSRKLALSAYGRVAHADSAVTEHMHPTLLHIRSKKKLLRARMGNRRVCIWEARLPMRVLYSKAGWHSSCTSVGARDAHLDDTHGAIACVRIQYRPITSMPRRNSLRRIRARALIHLPDVEQSAVRSRRSAARGLAPEPAHREVDIQPKETRTSTKASSGRHNRARMPA